MLFFLKMQSKTILFPPQHNELALAAKALAHPVRLGLLETLLAQPGASLPFLAKQLDLSMATAKKHLQELLILGIVAREDTTEGLTYHVAEAALVQIKHRLDLFFEKLVPYQESVY